MGRLIDGKWSTEWYASDAKGRFLRDQTKFHHQVTADGSSGFAAEPGRYHLYVSYACPWAHRTLIARALKRLDGVISLSVVHPFMGDDGWTFASAPGTLPDTENHAEFLHQVYTAAKPDYTGRVTVPILWDKRQKTIVNNESRQILRMLDTAFGAFADETFTLFPKGREDEVEAALDAIYTPINNGVYRAGFASKQEAYDEAVGELFQALDRYEELLGRQRFLLGDRLTGADVALFTTLFRFDPVYYVHFKCNVRRLVDYENLFGFVRDVYQLPGVAETCRLDHIKEHYYRSHPHINPTRIVPAGPILDYAAPHDRARRFAAR